LMQNGLQCLQLGLLGYLRVILQKKNTGLYPPLVSELPCPATRRRL
jgi:hypothetical protein